MTQLVCKCLNVSLSCPAVYLSPIDPTLIKANDRFFQNQLAEVSGKLSTVSTSQLALVSSRPLGKCSIKTCMNCGQDTHAVSSSDEKHFINLSLLSDPMQINLLRQNENYSELYKLILIPSTDIPPSAQELKTLSKTCQLEVIVQNLRHQAVTYLCEEQKEMEERIRAYSEQQYSQYKSLQSKVVQDRTALITALVKVQANKGNPLLVAPTLGAFPSFPSPPTTPDNPEQGLNDNVFERSPQLLPKTMVQVGGSRSLVENIRHNVKRRTYRSASLSHKQSIDSCTIFDMEGLEDDMAPFSLSDDEADTDDSNSEDGSRVGQRQSASAGRVQSGYATQLAYATSLPISVPLWGATNHEDISDDEDKNTSRDPQQIAASIQAMALAKRDDKDMFGDLPRRRLNTGDLVKSRPI